MDLTNLLVRSATAADLPVVVALLRDDDLGVTREATELAPYEAAFAEIVADPAHDVLVGVLGGEVVACLQLTVLPCLTHGGRRRAQVEGVRVAASARRTGVGAALVEAAVARAEAAGCGVVQLTTDHRRPEALRFYERLGFTATHHGLKRELG